MRRKKIKSKIVTDTPEKMELEKVQQEKEDGLKRNWQGMKSRRKNQIKLNSWSKWSCTVAQKKPPWAYYLMTPLTIMKQKMTWKGEKEWKQEERGSDRMQTKKDNQATGCPQSTTIWYSWIMRKHMCSLTGCELLLKVKGSHWENTCPLNHLLLGKKYVFPHHSAKPPYDAFFSGRLLWM